MVSDVSTEKEFEASVPKRLFLAPAIPNQINGPGDITADGKRFLFVVPESSSGPPSPFFVIMNWQASLKR